MAVGPVKNSLKPRRTFPLADLQARRQGGDFLLGEWRDGALFGDTPKQAFFVKCDAETNPPDVRERGEVVTLVGVAIVKPAEFVIFRIQQKSLDAQAS